MTGSSITFSAGGSVMFAGESAVDLYRLKVIRQGIKACKIGLRLNTAYTPTRVLKAAGQATGKTYKRGQYDQALADLDAVIAKAEAEIPVIVEAPR